MSSGAAGLYAVAWGGESGAQRQIPLSYNLGQRGYMGTIPTTGSPVNVQLLNQNVIYIINLKRICHFTNSLLQILDYFNRNKWFTASSVAR